MKNTSFAVFAVTLVVGLSGRLVVKASPSVERHVRSIWPFGGGSVSTEVPETTSAEPGLAGYDPAIDSALLQIKPDDRRIWKIHKYQGFDLRPIDLVPGDHTSDSFNKGPLSSGPDNQDLPLYPPLNQNEQSLPYPSYPEVFPNPQNGHQGYPSQQKPSGSHGGYPNHREVASNGGYPSGIPDSAGNPLYSPSSVGNNEETTEPVDLSFLDDLGGLAYFLPEPEEAENADQGSQYDVGSVPVVMVEEAKPGFLQSLLHKLTFGMLGAPAKEVKGESLRHPEAPSAGFVDSSNGFDAAVPTYHLPEAQGSYIAYRLPANHPAGAHGAPISSQNVYSQDTQSTPYVYNRPASPDSGSAGFSFPDSTGSDKSKGYTLVNPRGYQRGKPINAFVEGPADQLPHKTPALEYGAPAANSAPQNSPALEYDPPAANSAPQFSPALEYDPPAANSAPQNSPALEYGAPTVNSTPQKSPALDYGTPASKSPPQKSPTLQYGAPAGISVPQKSPALQYGAPAGTSTPQNLPTLQYGAPAENSAPQKSPSLQYGAPAVNSAPQKSPVLQYGAPAANSAPQKSLASQYGASAANSTPQKSPALQYGAPAANSALQKSPASQYGAPAANSTPQKSPALQYGAPSANSAPQKSPASQYGAPAANSAPQKSPASQYGAPAANSAPQKSPASQYGAPAGNSAPQKSPASQYGAPAANSAPQKSPASQYGAPAATSKPQKSPTSQYGAPDGDSAPQKSPALQHGAPDGNSAPQNSPAEDADRLVHPSEYSSINLSPPLPYRNPVDFGKYSKQSERRVSENEESDEIEETQEAEETDNFNEKPETTTSEVFVVTPDVEIGRTYSRIRSYGAGEFIR